MQKNPKKTKQTQNHYKSKSVMFKNGSAAALHVQTIPLIC